MLLECLSLPFYSTYIVCGIEVTAHMQWEWMYCIWMNTEKKSFSPTCTVVQLKRTEAHYLNDKCISEIALLTAFLNANLSAQGN